MKLVADLITEVLLGGSHFLQGVHSKVDDIGAVLDAVSAKGGAFGTLREHSDLLMSSGLRQSLLMALIPATAFDDSYVGSIDKCIEEHLASLGLKLPQGERDRLRDICINVRKLRHLSGTAARNATKTLADLRAMRTPYLEVLARQKNRCVWCGVPLDTPGVKPSLEHMAPKHIGDDMPDSSNWAIACLTCNSGKGDLISWATSPFAFGYLRGSHFKDPKLICIESRWIVLVRDRACDSCKKGPLEIELGVYRKISTGLPIPQYCAATCFECAVINSKEVLATAWCSEEGTRLFKEA